MALKEEVVFFLQGDVWSLDLIERRCAASSLCLSLLLSPTPKPSGLQGFILWMLLSPKTHLLPHCYDLALPLNAKCLGLSLRPQPPRNCRSITALYKL